MSRVIQVYHRIIQGEVGMVESYSFKEGDFERPRIGEVWMKKFVTAKDLGFR